MKKSNNHHINLIQSIKNTGGKSTTRSQVIVENTKGLVPVLVYDNFEKIKFSKIIKVPKSKISGNTNIEINFCLLGKNDQKVAKLKRKSPFSRNKAFIQMTKIKPGISATWIGPDRITLSCEQNDPRGKSVEIFYKNNLTNNWKSLTSQAIAYQQGYTGNFNLLSKELNSDVMLLRAISKNKQGEYGSFYDFALPVARYVLNIQDLPMETGYNSLSAYGLTSLSCIQGAIQIGLAAAKSVFLSTGEVPKLRKKEFALGEDNRRSLIKDITTHMSYDAILSLESINDTDISEGNFYEYTILAGTQDNENVFSRNIIQYLSPPDWIGASVKILSKPTNYTVAFKASVTQIENKGSTFLSYLKQSGIIDPLGPEIENIRQKLSQFFLFRVTKRNTFTGDASTKFIRPGALIESIMPGVPYLYSFELFVGNPNQIISNLAQDTNSILPLPLIAGNSQQRLSQNMKNFKPSIAGGLADTSTVSSENNVSQDLYDLINTGWKFSTLYPGVDSTASPSTAASISDINFYKINPSGENIIEWKIQGDSKVIDHFIIFSNANGGDISLAGAHHHKSNSSTYSFCDKRFRGAIGTLSYGVSIVFNNMQIGPPAYSTIKRLSR